MAGNMTRMVREGNAYRFFEDAICKISVSWEDRIQNDLRETEREGPK
jgi:hypothetical protein